MFFHGVLLAHVALAAADCSLEGLLELESSFLQISVQNVTLQVTDASEPWVAWSTLHLSIYLIAFIMIPVCAVAFAGPKWLLIATIMCADSTCTELPVAIFPVVAENPLTLGALVATKPLGQALATRLVIRFTRHQELQAMKSGLLLQGAGLLLQGFTPSLGAWFAARAAQGVASALILGASMVTAPDAIEEAAKETDYVDPMVTIYGMLLGVFWGPSLGAVGFSVQPFLPFVCLGLIELVLLAALHAKMDSPARVMPEPPSLLAPLQHDVISRPVTLVFLIAMYNAALQSMVFKVMEQDFQLSVAAAGFAWFFHAWPAVVVALSAGTVAQSIGFRIIMLTGILVAGTSALLADDEFLALVLVQLLATGVAIGAENATVPKLIEDVSLRYLNDPWTGMVLLNWVQLLGYVIGPLSAGLLFHTSSFQTMCRAFGVLLLGYALTHTAE